MRVNKNTRFTKIIRIDPKQKEWIREARLVLGIKTDAGFLDTIINHYKKYGKKRKKKEKRQTKIVLDHKKGVPRFEEQL